MIHSWNLKCARNYIQCADSPPAKITPCLSWVHFNGQITPVQCRSHMSHPRSIFLCVMQIHGLHLLFLKAHVSNVELPFARSDVTSVRKGRSQYTGAALDQRPQVKARASWTDKQTNNPLPFSRFTHRSCKACLLEYSQSNSHRSTLIETFHVICWPLQSLWPNS